MEKIHNIDDNYKNLISKILEEGYEYEDPNRKGVIRKEILSHTINHNFKEEGFPSISIKKLAFKSVVTELLWMLKGDTHIKYLIDNGCNFWTKDAYSFYLKNTQLTDTKETYNEFLQNIHKSNNIAGELGPIYGKQWRSIFDLTSEDLYYNDQIKYLVNNLKNKPLGTQNLVNSWNVIDLDDMALQPCHYNFQVVVRPLSILEQELFIRDESDKGWTVNKNIKKLGLELHFNMRSSDVYLGLPANISFYALLTLILGHLTNLHPLGIQGDLKKVHLYDNSIDASKELLTRKSSTEKSYIEFSSRYLGNVELFKKGELSLNHFIEQLEPNMFSLKNYFPQENIKVEMLARTN